MNLNQWTPNQIKISSSFNQCQCAFGQHTQTKHGHCGGAIVEGFGNEEHPAVAWGSHLSLAGEKCCPLGHPTVYKYPPEKNYSWKSKFVHKLYIRTAANVVPRAVCFMP